MFTRDIEIERLKAEYESLRRAQDSIMEKVDLTAAVLIRLEESINDNQEAINGNLESIDAIRQALIANNEALQAIMEHFEIPPKPGTGFNPEQEE